MVRVDHEDVSPAPPARRRCSPRRLAGDRAADVVVLSDYGKGVFSDAFLRHCLDAARAAGKTVIVDPKRNDFSAYRGATIITPNRKELADATGLPCETDAEAARAAGAAHKGIGARIFC